MVGTDEGNLINEEVLAKLKVQKGAADVADEVEVLASGVITALINYVLPPSD